MVFQLKNLYIYNYNYNRVFIKSQNFFCRLQHNYIKQQKVFLKKNIIDKKKIIKIEMHESHSPLPFIKFKN